MGTTHGSRGTGLGILTLKQAADELGIADDTLRLIIRRGEIRTTRVGQRPRIEVAELRRYLEAGRSAA